MTGTRPVNDRLPGRGQYLSCCVRSETRSTMKILVSTLLLALFGEKESKCSTGEELTGSFVPAGLQILNYYLSQIRGSEEDFDIGKSVPGTFVRLGVPTVVVTYNTEENPIGTEVVEKLAKLVSALDEEATEQDLAKCRGITSEVMRELETSSRSSARRQLSFVLGRIFGGELKNQKTKNLIREVLAELKDDNSGLSKALSFLSPLKYLSDISLE